MRSRVIRLPAALVAACVAAAAVCAAVPAAERVSEAVAAHARVKSGELPTVIIDAGHGGFDGGAVARDGTNEKDINLAVSLELEKTLKALGFTTVMTRSEDKSLESESGSLKSKKRSDIMNRFALMQKYPDSVYLCIHQNCFSGASSSGAQVFYTAENAEAKRLAQSVQDAVKAAVQPDNRRVIKPCERNVYIVCHAPVTAVLIECGFLSNAGDLERLKNEDYRKKLAFAIADGLVQYLNGSEENGES